ncbi:MAG: class I SAM-dependent methyltransferase, partial [Chloroflexales bacterium]|nr:class I SAM-dependent methyltransferase [Chloroflexales bacterium]
MADERIDPAAREDKWVVDHYARYLFASSVAAGRRALDVACGTGFGSHLLAESGATHVLGADLAQDAVDYATA